MVSAVVAAPFGKSQVVADICGEAYAVDVDDEVFFARAEAAFLEAVVLVVEVETSVGIGGNEPVEELVFAGIDGGAYDNSSAAFCPSGHAAGDVVEL